MFYLQACEDSIFNKSRRVNEEPSSIFYRSDCQECPDDDECCCYVELNGSDEAFLQFCGTSDGGGSCSGDPVCGLLSPTNGGQTINLDNFNPRQKFCMLQGYPFWITNSSTTDDVDIIISCQGDLTNPQEIMIHLDPLETVYIETNGSCQVGEC